MENFFIRLSKVLHWLCFLIGLTLFISTTFFGYGIIIGSIYLLVFNGLGWTISYIISGEKKIFPFY